MRFMMILKIGCARASSAIVEPTDYSHAERGFITFAPGIDHAPDQHVEFFPGELTGGSCDVAPVLGFCAAVNGSAWLHGRSDDRASGADSEKV
jgi:hypothetical protein